jgi:hypothetical protein
VGGVHTGKFQIWHERCALGLYIEKILNGSGNFDLGNFSNAHPQIDHANRRLVASQSRQWESNVL